uniref:Olfactory receptor family 8 subfamily J member 3 n=1 Tax=Macaca mulatta TaxID=9544 RepID=A0A5F8AKY3_MACMU
MTGLGLHVHEKQSPVEHYDHCQVGSTGRKSLLSASRIHPENGYKDEQGIRFLFGKSCCHAWGLGSRNKHIQHESLQRVQTLEKLQHASSRETLGLGLARSLYLDEFPNSDMAPENFTSVTEFVLTGVSGCPELQIPLFLVFLVLYVLTLAGNLGIITLTSADSRLQTPMYFFLRQLAIINLGNSTVIAPKMLINFLVKKKTTSFYECATQLGGFLFFIVSEVMMLAVMAYDRYVAICNSLLYMVVVSRRLCILLVSLTYLYGFSTAIVVSPCIFSMSYCSSNIINHFYCDIAPLLALSCSDTYLPETIVFISAATNLVFSMITVLVSYFNIVLSILRIHSSEGRNKAFSTCASHMMAVTVFYGTMLFMYLQPQTNHSLDTDKMASVFYTLVIPMLNPLIYSLRNNDVKVALKKFMENPC